MTTIRIDPVTRISGLLNIEVQVENNKIVDAKVSGSQFRGFEKMFEGRPPFDIIRLVPRVCGICSTHHAITSVRAFENAMNITPDLNGRIARDIANGFEMLQNYIRHIYFFVIPDYVKLINVNPLFKTGTSEQVDYRLNDEDTNKINEDYLEAVRLSREAHKALAVLVGKVPHPHGIWIGGITTDIGIQQIQAIKYSISIIKDFINRKLIPDIEIISKVYNDYYKIGSGYGNLMNYGLYNDYDKNINYVDAGLIIKGQNEKFDINNITRDIENSWMKAPNNILIPGISAPPEPDAFKPKAYTWIDAPRYRGSAMEVGALARMTISGKYRHGISVMDRIVAKAYEAKVICEVIEKLIEMLKLSEEEQQVLQSPIKAKGVGLSEAERGSLAHWITVENGMISNYTLIPPSAWNFSPTDRKGLKGTVEQALIGAEINDINAPVEIGRIVRSFDPCLNCAVHVTSNRHKPINIIINS